MKFGQSKLVIVGHVDGQTDGRWYTTTRYDYNLTIMKFPKPATDTIYPHIKF